jgi:hypothetical protein
VFKRRRQLPEDTQYPQSYEGDICVENVSKANTNRSTVELKVTGLPKRQEWTKNLDTGIEPLAELPAHTSPDETSKSEVSKEVLPEIQCESTSSELFQSLISSADGIRSSVRLANRRGPVAAENVAISTDRKRKATAEISDDSETESNSKRTKTGNSSLENSSTHDMEGRGEGAAGSSEPQEMSMKHPVNIQNGIYAAERLSCSLDITHSLNFILRGEIRLSNFFRTSQLIQDLVYDLDTKRGVLNDFDLAQLSARTGNGARKTTLERYRSWPYTS